MAEYSQTAGSTINLHLKAIKSGATLTPDSYDDANLCSFPTISYLQAYLYYTPNKHSNNLPCMQKEFVKFFPKSKLFIIKTRSYYSIVSASKGGIIKIFRIKKPKLTFSDTGWVCSTLEGLKICTGYLNPNFEIIMNENSPVSIEIKGKCNVFTYRYLTPITMAVSRITLPVLSRISILKKLLKARLRRMLITGRKEYPLSFHRKLIFYENEVKIADELIPLKKIRLRNIQTTSSFAPIYSYSVGLFQKHDIKTHECYELKVNPQKPFKGLKILRTINSKSGKIEYG